MAIEERVQKIIVDQFTGIISDTIKEAGDDKDAIEVLEGRKQDLADLKRQLVRWGAELGFQQVIG